MLISPNISIFLELNYSKNQYWSKFNKQDLNKPVKVLKKSKDQRQHLNGPKKAVP